MTQTPLWKWSELYMYTPKGRKVFWISIVLCTRDYIIAPTPFVSDKFGTLKYECSVRETHDQVNNWRFQQPIFELLLIKVNVGFLFGLTRAVSIGPRDMCVSRNSVTNSTDRRGMCVRIRRTVCTDVAVAKLVNLLSFPGRNDFWNATKDAYWYPPRHIPYWIR